MDKYGKRSWRMYVIGLFVAVGCLVAAELIWLPAPLHTGGGMQWIEFIDWLFYLLAAVPLCWLMGAFSGIIGQPWTWSWTALLPRLLRLIIMVLSTGAVIIIWFAKDRLDWLLVCTVIVVPLLFIDMFISEIAARSRKMPWHSISALALMAALLLVFLWPTGYSVTYPGMTLNLNRYAHIEGGEKGGSINGVLVFDRPSVLADRLYAKLLPLYQFEVIPEDEPPLSETYAQVVAMKTDANRVAAAIAMQKAGMGSGITPIGVRIIAIVKDSPAEGRLQAGDIIQKIDGVSVSSSNEMIAYMTESVKPGQTVSIKLKRHGDQMEISVPSGASADDPARPVLGVSIQTELKLDAPLPIDYNSYMAHIGGPSHGAMLTLAFIDQLTPGGITNGLHIAGTGTIEPDGTVGMVGGIPQKAYAVSRTAADVFFVPAAGEQAARSAAPELNIVAVDTIDDILSWLAERS